MFMGLGLAPSRTRRYAVGESFIWSICVGCDQKEVWHEGFGVYDKVFVPGTQLRRAPVPLDRHMVRREPDEPFLTRRDRI